MLFWAFANVLVSAAIFVHTRSKLMRGYLLINYVLIINPVFMWVLLGEAHPLFVPDNNSYAAALAYMVCFNAVLGCSFSILMRHLPPSGFLRRNLIGHRVNATRHMTTAILGMFALAGLGLIGKLVLHSERAFLMLDAGGQGPFLQALKMFSGFDLLALLVMGEIKNTGRARVPGLALLLMVSFGFAFFSGSRAQTIVVIIVALIVYRSEVYRFRYVSLPALVAIAPTLFVLFPLLGYYRIADYNLEEAQRLVEYAGLTRVQIMSDVLVTRLNYLEPLARAVDYVDLNGPAGGSVYWNNIIGLIPRLIWVDKPLISNDSQLLGHQLGLVTLDDTSTSIGLQVVGESFFEYGWVGLWVAIFQALIFASAQRYFYRPGNPAAMAVYIMFCFYILRADGYFSIAPGLVWFSISITFFFGVLGFLLSRPRFAASAP